MKQRSAYYVVAAIIFIFGLFLIIPNPVVGPVSDTSQTSTISYQGVEGKNALDLLKDSHDVETKHYDFGDLVTAIDGKSADATTFWAFYVNGKMAEVGASDYQTKTGDQIEWRLENIN